MSDAIYIAQEVKREDRDRYLTAMFAPPVKRQSLLALYAFNMEVAKIREGVSEHLIGRMKLQWWRDVIAAIYDGTKVPQGNPVVVALEGTVQAHALTRARFEALIDAREADMADDPPRDLADLEHYAEGTAVPLNLLALKILDVSDQASMDAARHGGVAWALTGILRAVLFHAHASRLLLPQDLLAAEGLTVHDIQERKNAARLATVISGIAHIARAHIAKARAFKVDRRALPVLLTVTLADAYLHGLKARHFDVFDPRHPLQRPSVLRLFWAAWRGSF